ncbi:hypothetical protein M0811_00833 [Anaeramoeba ignava]|uniref:Ricin B lectin domain-containing protein n=1 Tax=Anaeramoeba ignava TaxID=1746090 RepID=A0A9Q0RCZ8_ANAIG|nr:hypothetical protein M0811_00833 [Anaeramoeba ignava]
MFAHTYYRIFHKELMQCLETSGDKLQLNLPTTETSQLWKFVPTGPHFYIRSKSTKKQIEIKKKNSFILQEQNENDFQLWDIKNDKGSLALISSFEDKVPLMKSNLEKIQKKQKNQNKKNLIQSFWILIPQKIQTYRIINRRSGKAIEILETDGKYCIVQNTMNQSSDQKWSLKYTNTQWFFGIFNKKKQKSISIEGKIEKNSQNIFAKDYSESDSDLWTLRPYEFNSFLIISKLNGLCLTVSDNSTSSFAYLTLAKFDKSCDAQFWFLIKN